MRSFTPQVLAEARRLHADGKEAVNAGRLADAGAQLREGLEVLGWFDGRSASWDRATSAIAARLMMTLAYADAEQGDAERGLRTLADAEAHVAEEDTGILIQQRALILRMSGRLNEALENFSRAKPLLVRFEQTTTLLALYLNRGATQGDAGKYSAALKDFSDCYELADELGHTVWAAKALHARGIVENLLGDVPASLASLEHARRLYELHAPDMGPVLLAAQCYVLHSAGLLHEAVLRLDEAIEGMRSLRQHHPLAIAEVLRAQLSLELGKPERAAEEWSVGAARARRQGDHGMAAGAELIGQLAGFESRKSTLAMADECLELAGRHRGLGRRDDAQLATLLAVRLLIRHGEVSRAASVVHTVSRGRLYEQLSVRLTRTLAKAELASAVGDARTAFRRVRAGLGMVQDYRSRLGSVELQVGATSLGRDVASLGLSLALSSGQPSTVFAWSERSRAQAFRLPPIRPVEDAEIADLLARDRQLRDQIRKAELSGRSSREDRALCADLERTLRERSWLATGPGESIPEYSATQIKSELKRRNAALVSFLAHEGRMHVLVLDGKLRHVELGSSTEVEEATRRLVADLDALQGRRLPPRMEEAIRSSIHHQTDWLANALFGKILPMIGDRDLVVVPTQLLSSLPWGLLPPLRGRPVTVAPSAAVWMAAVTREWSSKGVPLLAAGPDLTHAESELAQIATRYPQGTVLKTETATAAATLAALDGAPIAHLAAHGHHEPDNVLFSRLDFADGPLMAYDIARLAAPPRHVTLSACDVGRSVVAVGDETLGFTAALLYAGTSTVVSSVARVAHEVAADVMVEYHRLISEGIAPARALAEANAKHDLAPFVLFGAG